MDDRTDPQYKLRMPAELHSKLKGAAKENHRSLNAEMVARLQDSFSAEPPPSNELMSADRARELAVKARKNASEIMRNRILRTINESVTKGHSMALVDFRDMELELIPQADQDRLIDYFSGWLEGAGYRIEWDGPDNIFIGFDDL